VKDKGEKEEKRNHCFKNLMSPKSGKRQPSWKVSYSQTNSASRPPQSPIPFTLRKTTKKKVLREAVLDPDLILELAKYAR